LVPHWINAGKKKQNIEWFTRDWLSVLARLIMDTKSLVQERVSVFADGETSDEQLEIALADLRQEEAKEAWELYHRIGDILRSDEMDVPFSSGFSSRMAASLAAEPTLIAPKLASKPARSRARRFALPGVLAAAAAAVAFVGTPQLMVAFQGHPASAPALAVIADGGVERTALTGGARTGQVLRAQGIDEYLMAHQRFSPSVYSSAQYARSATFANESGK
jgi:sigma-E factor negative regulatory protein RseA